MHSRMTVTNIPSVKIFLFKIIEIRIIDGIANYPYISAYKKVPAARPATEFNAYP
jgi:hypothetical protein